MDSYEDECDVEMPTEYRRTPDDVALLEHYCYPRYMDLKEFSRLPAKERIKIARELGLSRRRLTTAMAWYWRWRAAYIAALRSQRTLVIDRENHTGEFRRKPALN